MKIMNHALWGISAAALATALLLAAVPAGPAALAQEQRPSTATGGGDNAAPRTGMMFWFLDRNDDGFIDAAEMTAFRGKLFETLDRDGDGSITKEEAARMGQHRGGRGWRRGHRDGWQGRHHGDGERGHGWRRGGRDDDDRGYGRRDRAGDDDNADWRERRAERRAEFMEKRWQHRFGRLDANNDGAVSREEFLAKMPRLFVYADLDKDGRVSRQEAIDLREFLGESRGQRGGWFR